MDAAQKTSLSKTTDLRDEFDSKLNKLKDQEKLIEEQREHILELENKVCFLRCTDGIFLSVLCMVVFTIIPREKLRNPLVVDLL